MHHVVISVSRVRNHGKSIRSFHIKECKRPHPCLPSLPPGSFRRLDSADLSTASYPSSSSRSLLQHHPGTFHTRSTCRTHRTRRSLYLRRV
ncbi:hypothetical protein M3J09_000346 [Ascochyta lentis]